MNYSASKGIYTFFSAHLEKHGIHKLISSVLKGVKNNLSLFGTMKSSTILSLCFMKDDAFGQKWKLPKF